MVAARSIAGTAGTESADLRHLASRWAAIAPGGDQGRVALEPLGATSAGDVTVLRFRVRR